MRYLKLFAVSDAELGKTNVIEHKTDTGSGQPIKQRPRRLSFHMQTEIDKPVDDMKRNVIEESTSPWSSSVVLVKKIIASLMA